MDGIRGILHLDKKVDFYSVSDPLKKVGDVTLRWVLYRELKMSDGHCLFEEIHQAEPMGAVEVAVPNCEEAERILLMMQRNGAAFLTNYLRDNSSLPEELVTELIAKSMDPILVNSIGKCKWEKDTWTLTTPEDVEQEKLKKMEDAAWYSDVFGDNMVEASKKEKLQYANKEALDELHCDHSFKSIHHRKGSYVGSPEAETFQVGSKDKPVEVEGGPTLAGYENLSQAELIAMLRKHNISPSGTVGSPPNSKRSGSGRGAEDEESDSDSSDSSQDSDSSSDESMSDMEKGASPSSAEGDTAGRTPGHGE